LLTVNDLNKTKLNHNDILFLNWQKIVSKAAENRVLRRPDDENIRKESGVYFEDFIEATHEDAREIVLIVDESHKNVETELSQEIVNKINPKLVIFVSATPKNIPSASDERNNMAAYVEVARQKVIAEGLIKEKIVVQTDEDLKNAGKKDFDELLLDLGLVKRTELIKEFKSLGKTVNPLVLIQLPNDDKELVSAGQKTKEELVLNYLKTKNIDEKKIALWFDGKQQNLEFITENDSPIEFMLFKQAAGTGWDCPRAHVLVMFREIKSSIFYTQTVGRILRMPEPEQKEDYKKSPNLRTGFLYTNYRRDEIKIPDQDGKNKPFIFVAKRRDNMVNVELESGYVSRIDYGDLNNSAKFQASFVDSMNTQFRINKDDILGKGKQKLHDVGIELAPKISSKIVVDAKFEDYDNINFDFKKRGHDLSIELSENDIEKTFNYYCYLILKEQTEESAKNDLLPALKGGVSPSD